jgi:hypothetical protein
MTAIVVPVGVVVLRQLFLLHHLQQIPVLQDKNIRVVQIAGTHKHAKQYVAQIMVHMLEQLSKGRMEIDDGVVVV